jgi:hypothetical protein
LFAADYGDLGQVKLFVEKFPAGHPKNKENKKYNKNKTI